jgi:hypothetical protein
LAKILRADDNFQLVTIFEEFGEAESKIADPAMIQDCGLKNRVLLTGDQELIYVWEKEIVESKIAVFVTTNSHEGPNLWGPRIVHAKKDIVRELVRRDKPFTARISTEGRVTQVRIYEGTQWKTITIGKLNPPHKNKQKREAN